MEEWEVSLDIGKDWPKREWEVLRRGKAGSLEKAWGLAQGAVKGYIKKLSDRGGYYAYEVQQGTVLFRVGGNIEYLGSMGGFVDRDFLREFDII